MKRLKKQELHEPTEINLTQNSDIELSDDVTFSIGIPIEMMFDEFKGDMLKNIKTVQKTLNTSDIKAKEGVSSKKTKKKH